MRIARITSAALAAALVAASLAGPAAASTPRAKVCTTKKVKGKKVRVCRTKPAPTPPKVVTTVTVDLLPGSHATVDVPALPLPGGQIIIGAPTTRDVALSGQLKGELIGAFKLKQDINAGLSSGTLAIAPIDVLSDPACGGAPTLRIDPISVATIDPARPTSALLKASGDVSADAHVILRLAFASRTLLGCDAPLLPTGYTDTPFAVKVAGKVGTKGLLELALASAPTQVTVGVCLVPGEPAKPCAQAPAGYPVTITVALTARITLGRK